MNPEKTELGPWSAPEIGWIYIIATTLIVNWLMTTFIDSRLMSCWIVGPIVGYWIGRRYFYAASTPHKEVVDVEVEESENWAKPFPREYTMPLQVAFDGVAAALEKITFNVGDKLHVKPDTFLKRITAKLHVRDKLTEEFVETEIQFEDTEAGNTIIRYEFDCRRTSSNRTKIYGKPHLTIVPTVVFHIPRKR